jgi:hypothetical protein
MGPEGDRADLQEVGGTSLSLAPGRVPYQLAATRPAGRGAAPVGRPEYCTISTSSDIE